MAQYYFDTSALVKRYRREQGTDLIDGLFADAESSLVISRLGIIETISALALNVRVGELPSSEYAIARKKFLGDVSKGTLKAVRLLVAHYRGAERLIHRYATTHRFRTLDALQLSTALDLHEQGRIDTFVCADQPLCEIAALENIAVINPVAAV